MGAPFPTPGCIVEYLEDNQPQIAMVLEESSGRLRLLSPSRRESKLGVNRIMPWLGPAYSPAVTRDEACRILEEHKLAREKKAALISPLDVWELAQGEIARAPASWFAELFENEPDADTMAAYGRALLACKTHFRFQPPEFQVYEREVVDKRLAEQKQREEREALLGSSAAFLKLLWDIAAKKRTLSQAALAAAAPPEAIAEKLASLLKERMINPDLPDGSGLWEQLSRGLPDVPHLPLQLLVAWGKLKPHHDFWLDRAGYDAGDAWWQPFAAEVGRLAAIGKCSPPECGACDLPFVSIDGDSTVDIDDAFHLESSPDGWRLTMAFAAPALAWPFGGPLDKAVSRRATSIYLPEGDLHMLPAALGTDAFSLLAGEERPALCCRIEIDSEGAPGSVEPFLARVKLAANLRYKDVEAALTGAQTEARQAAAHAGLLAQANRLALALEQRRIAHGAVIMQKPDAHLVLSGKENEIKVELIPDADISSAQRIVAEMMILASSALADWAFERQIPLIHRTQNVAIPREYAGIWSRPAEQAQIMRSLIPSILEVEARPHAALGAHRYVPITSPLRRYGDLLNEAQIGHFIRTGEKRWDAGELERLLDAFTPALEAASHVQKYRVRYWKLLYFRQQGDKRWWQGVITDENEHFVTVTLPEQGIVIRGRRELFDERASPGMAVTVRVGKVNPLYNEIQIVETMPGE